MKKCKISLFLSVCILLGCLSACTNPFLQELPTDGVWYCEELKFSIDFALYQTVGSHCAKLYDESGGYEEILCYVDYGTGIFFCSEDCADVDILAGDYTFIANVLVVTSREDGTKYSFDKV